MATLEEKRMQQRERRILRIMKTCVHFTGIQYDSCRANVNYHEQFGDGVGCFASIPCTYAPGEDVKSCPKVEYLSRTEAEADYALQEAESQKATQAINATHSDAKAKGYGVGKGGSDSMKCPLCSDGVIHYRVAGVNGHMHAGCSSGCVSWME